MCKQLKHEYDTLTSRPSRGRATIQVLPSLRGDGLTVSGTF